MSSLQLLTRRTIIPLASSVISASFFLERNEHDHRYRNGGKCRCDASSTSPISNATSNFPHSSDIEKHPNIPSSLEVQTKDVEVTQAQNLIQSRAPPLDVEIKVTDGPSSTNNEMKVKDPKVTVINDGEEMFHDLFPMRQLWSPKVKYPLWDKNWDGRALESTGSEETDRERQRKVRKDGVTRHIILVRHGQYDETHKEDEKRILTTLGREQAELTGKRIAEIIKGFDGKFDPCNVTTVRVSNMARAKETADIIAKHLPSHVHRAKPDINLNEDRPCHHIPCGKVSSKIVEKIDVSHKIIEKAFQTYFHRADYHEVEVEVEVEGTVEKAVENGKAGNPLDGEIVAPSLTSDDSGEETTIEEGRGHPQHEFEIIVCHGNVIRYMFCRALQLPPEAWLRLTTFNCSLTYLAVRPTGTVSCRMLGDIGHLGYDHSTFSMHHGFNW